VIVTEYETVHIINGYESVPMEYIQSFLCLLQYGLMSDQSGKADLFLPITKVFSK
jgi:hypothetical protein